MIEVASLFDRVAYPCRETHVCAVAAAVRELVRNAVKERACIAPRAIHGCFLITVERCRCLN